MSDDLFFAIALLILYGLPFMGLLYIGKKRPTWRKELFGVLFALLSKVALYTTAILFYSGVLHLHITDFLLNFSRASSLTMGVVANIYIVLAIKGIRQ